MDAIRREEGDEIDELVPKFQDFTFSELESTELQKLKAKKLSATAYFKAQKAYLHLDIYTLCEDGVIKFDDEKIVLRNGSMKLFLRVRTHFPWNLSFFFIIYDVISVTRHHDHVGFIGTIKYFRDGTEWDNLKD